MIQAFKLPDLGEGIHEGEIVNVLVAAGDRVEEDQVILEVETDKATVEIPSPYGGVVREIAVKPGDLVQVGDVLMTFDDGDSADITTAPEKKPEPEPKPMSQPVARVEAGPVPASPATRRLARELGVDLHQVPPSGPAGLVTAQDVRAFAEGEIAALPDEPEREPAVPPSPSAVRPATVEVPPLPDFSRWGPVERVPLRSVRRATAKHMALAWSQIPHVSHQDVVDVTELERFRRKHKAEIEARGGKLTLTVFLLKAIVAALKAYPQFNASLDADAEEILLKKYYHLGVAVDSEKGLIVPVVRDVDRKSVTGLAVELTDLTRRTRAGEARLEELQGGTFTLTNIGALGGTGFAPIVNYPEVAILGAGAARLEPVVRGDLDHYEMVPRLRMPLVLAFDHRVLDGAEAARFMNALIETLEDPEKLLLKI